MLTYNCKIHGQVKAHKSGKFPRCSICNNDRMRTKHQELRRKAVAYKGGKCIQCGYANCIAALEFHHRDPSQKEVMISRVYNRTWDTLVKELDKCDLVCANCHREIHAGLV